MGLTQERALNYDDLADEELVRRCLLREEAAVRALTGRYNRRLYRIARSFLRNDGEAEDVVQATYVRAFTQLGRFRGESSFATWLTRIAMNEALGRIRRRRPTVEWQEHGEERIQAEIIAFPMASKSRNPEQTMMQQQLRDVLERSIDALPDTFRTAFVARMVEGMSIEETAALLGIKPETVKTRVHRARQRLRDDLDKQLGPFLGDAFPFDGARCERMTVAVLRHLGMSA